MRTVKAERALTALFQVTLSWRIAVGIIAVLLLALAIRNRRRRRGLSFR